MRLTTGQKETRSITYLIAAQVLALQPSLVVYVTPIYFGALARNMGLSNQQLAGIGTVEALAAVIVVASIALFIGRLDLRKVGLAAVSVMAIAILLCAATQEFEQLLALRALVGASLSVLASAAMVYIAATAIPVRWFGWQMTLTTLIVMAGLAGLPIIEREFGLVGFYVTLLILTPATLWAVHVLPAHPKPASQALEGRASYAQAAGWRNPAAIVALLAVLMYSAYVYPMYNFADRIGDAIGMLPEHIGFVLSATTPLGLVGSLLASTFGNRFGSVRPIVVSAALAAVGFFVFSIWTDVLGYWVSIGIMSFVWNFAQPYLVATVGRADVDGRFVFLNGPAAEGGRLLTTFGFAGILGLVGPAGPALLGALLMTVSAVLIFAAIRMLGKSAAACRA